MPSDTAPKKHSDGMILGMLAAVGAGLYFLSQKSAPSVPQTAATSSTTIPTAGGGSTTLTATVQTPTVPATLSAALTQTQQQITWLKNCLASFGWISIPVWYSAAGPPTEQPQYPPQQSIEPSAAIIALYQAYFWQVNIFFGWNYSPTQPGANVNGVALSGAATDSPQNNPAAWTTMQDNYTELVAQLGPAIQAVTPA